MTSKGESSRLGRMQRPVQSRTVPRGSATSRSAWSGLLVEQNKSDGAPNQRICSHALQRGCDNSCRPPPVAASTTGQCKGRWRMGRESRRVDDKRAQRQLTKNKRKTRSRCQSRDCDSGCSWRAPEWLESGQEMHRNGWRRQATRRDSEDDD